MSTTQVAQDTRNTLRALAALLSYPDANLRAGLPEIRTAFHTARVLPAAQIEEVDALIDSLEADDPFETESRYVETFDRGRATSLHLFEHVHGDSRERGPAMVDLARTYEQAGLYLGEGELPDYVPVVLEFVSTQPPREAQAFLGEMGHLFGGIEAALRKRQSPYAGAMSALLGLAGVTPQKSAKAVADEPLDEAWAEPPVFQGCSTQGQARPGAPQPIRFMAASDSVNRSANQPARGSDSGFAEGSDNRSAKRSANGSASASATESVEGSDNSRPPQRPEGAPS